MSKKKDGLEEKDVILKKIFPYSIQDKTTWPWINCLVNVYKDKTSVKWIKNPTFKYGHLIKGY